jgi:hypothetical protein
MRTLTSSRFSAGFMPDWNHDGGALAEVVVRQIAQVDQIVQVPGEGVEARDLAGGTQVRYAILFVPKLGYPNTRVRSAGWAQFSG